MKKRANFGAGNTVNFHGAFKSKAAAAAKEAATPGAFLKNVRYGAGDYRWLVLTKKANPKRKTKRKRLQRKPRRNEVQQAIRLGSAELRRRNLAIDWMVEHHDDYASAQMLAQAASTKYGFPVAGLIQAARQLFAASRKNPLFTRGEKRRMRKKIKHAVKGAARRGIMKLFGAGKHKQQPARARHRGTSRAASGVRADVISALVNQGYSRAAAASMTPQASVGDSFDSLFRRAMKRNPKKKPHHRGRGGTRRKSRKRNPEQSGQSEDRQAIKAFRGFHGADPEKVTAVLEEMVTQGKFWLVGRLFGYDLHQFPLHRDEHNRNRRPNVDCWNQSVMLCADPPRSTKDKLGRQLFLFGGNQDMEPALKQHFDIGSNVQLVVLGVIGRIWYVTRKSMHNFELESYVHRFGEEGGEKPLLLYDRLNKKQWIVGGDYTITERGIEN
jgi:hypothetical protein